eukprot:jgi/Picsp_1/6282/NSC_03632-R1_zinc finger rad18 domain-containing protein c1orf124 homolog
MGEAGVAADELVEPTPDIHHLFCYYNDLYFSSSLGGVIVEWSSSRMTSCGGTCAPLLGGALIRLSEPILQLRPVADLKDVLLHEMIHAYMMVHKIQDNDPGGHGDVFKSWMKRINVSKVPDMHRPLRGYKISVFHTMYAEVDYYRQHHWKCSNCGDLVKRSINRKPQPADCRWHTRDIDCKDLMCKWHMHAKYCGGEYIKVKEPEKKSSVGIKEKNYIKDTKNQRILDSFSKPTAAYQEKADSSGPDIIDLTSECQTDCREVSISGPNGAQRAYQENQVPEDVYGMTKNIDLSCPLCGMKYGQGEFGLQFLNEHLDACCGASV